jgi:pimeloyl-CoA dehydrogenase small subunit
MNLEPSDEQRLLKESLARLLADRYGFEQRRAHAAAPEGWSRALWAAYAELGVLGLPFAEADGGFGGGAAELLLVAEAFGGALVLEPWVATLLLGGGCLRHGADAALRARLVPGIVAGDTLLAFAQVEPQARHDLFDVLTRATRDGDAWRLDGRKGVVVHGDCADWLCVTARTGGERRDRQGIGVFLVEAVQPGVARRGYTTLDGLRAAEVTLSGARGVALGDAADGLPLIERVVEEAIAALAAEAVGAMDAALKLTLDYLRTRRQFGRAIGEFQVVQHRAADMLTALEQARSMALHAGMLVEDGDAEARRRGMAAVKVQIGRSARFVAQQAIQLHGGIGMTMEYAIGHYARRLTAIDLLFGDAEHHLRRLAA